MDHPLYDKVRIDSSKTACNWPGCGIPQLLMLDGKQAIAIQYLDYIVKHGLTKTCF